MQINSITYNNLLYQLKVLRNDGKIKVCKCGAKMVRKVGNKLEFICKKCGNTRGE